jgi:hypothetical protein
MNITDKLAIELQSVLADVDAGNNETVLDSRWPEAHLALAHYKLRQTVTGKVEQGKAEPVVGIPAFPQTDNQKHQAYLDYVNNFITVERFAEHYDLTEVVANDIIEQGRKIHQSQIPFPFTVIFVSTNTNSFGLKSIIFLNKHGEGWEILKSAYSGDTLPKRGDVVNRIGDRFQCGSYECPCRLTDTSPKAAAKILKEVKGA